MEHCTSKSEIEKAIPTWGPDTIEARMRTRIRETIEMVVEEELEAALGAAPSVRVGETRQGYRHGTRERTLTTSVGPTSIAMPRARMRQADGTTTEWRSETVRRYQRRTVLLRCLQGDSWLGSRVTTVPQAVYLPSKAVIGGHE
jgi:hypothetical protein